MRVFLGVGVCVSNSNTDAGGRREHTLRPMFHGILSNRFVQDIRLCVCVLVSVCTHNTCTHCVAQDCNYVSMNLNVCLYRYIHICIYIYIYIYQYLDKHVAHKPQVPTASQKIVKLATEAGVPAGQISQK